MVRILVTGSAGFIGYHLSNALMSQGHEVCGIDGLTDYYDRKLKTDRLDLLKRDPHYAHHTIMLEDATALALVVDAFEPEIVFHLAAQAGVRYSLENPEAYISSNVIGTHNLLEILRRRPPRHLLIASTSSVYGGNTAIPFAETDRADAPVSLYAATKKSAEAIAHSYSHLFKIPTTCFRFFTVYGPWGRPDMALFKFVKALRSGDPIDIYGYGEMKRDFTYVADLVDAIQKLAMSVPDPSSPAGEVDSVSPVAPFRTVNIAGGAPVGLLDFVSAVEAATGIEAVKNLLPMQPGDVRETFARTELLEALIGEVPTTPVEEGVASFVEWYDSYMGPVSARS